MKTTKSFSDDVKEQLTRLRERHPEPVHSAHEGYALILEEVDELWDEVKKKNKLRDYDAMYHELVQVAARAKRLAEDVIIPRMIQK